MSVQTIDRAARSSTESDAELIAATRAGDMDAYAQLWLRHAEAGIRAARAITSIADPDDLVSEAFAAILQTIRTGGGPTDAFRPYLYTAIRNHAISWARKSRDVPVEDIDVRLHATTPDPSDVVADRATLSEVFHSLPERWRSLLWYLEVEGMKPREIGALMGMSANATSALAYRARAGLRQAWIDLHIRDPRRPAECRWVCEQAASGKRLSRRDEERMSRHLEVCSGCVLVADDVERLRGVLRAVLLPLVLGSAGAAAFVADGATPASAAGKAGEARGHAGSSARHPGVVAVATGITIVLLAAIIGLAQGALLAAADSGSATLAAASREFSTPPHLTLSAATSSPSPAAPRTEDAQPAPPPPVVPAPPASVVPAPQPPAKPTPTPRPTPTPTPSTDPVTTELEAPVLDVPATTDVAVPGPVQGTALPGAHVTLISSTGAVLAETAAGADGRFAAVLPGDLLADGMSVIATQALPGHDTSGPSAAIGPFHFRVPAIAAAAPLELVDADADGTLDDLVLELSGTPGDQVLVAVDGMWTGRTHVLGDGPVQRYARDVAAGEHSFTVRYLDPVTGGTGVAVTVYVTVPGPPVDAP